MVVDVPPADGTEVGAEVGVPVPGVVGGAVPPGVGAGFGGVCGLAADGVEACELVDSPKPTSAASTATSATPMTRSTRLIPDTPPVWPTVRGGSGHTVGPGYRALGPGPSGRTRRLGLVDGVDARSVTAAGGGGGVPGPAAGDQDGLDRVLTVPNLVTMVRLACIPLYVWLLFGADRQTGAAVVLAVLGATDWVDGYVARRFHQVSTLGKVLDPVADRILVVTAVVTIMVQGAVPVWFGVATLLREVVVSGAVLLLASLGAARIDVLWIGKAGTFALMTAYPLFLLAHGPATWQTVLHVAAWAIGLLGLALAWVAAASYVPVARRALIEGRRPVARHDSDDEGKTR